MPLPPRALLERHRITSGHDFRLKHHDPAATGGLDHAGSAAMLADGVARLSALQNKLYPQKSWSLLCVFEGMDTSGKDGTIGHVMSGVNPQGVTVTSFQPPSAEELAHDFLWRASRALPRRGQIGIFNRSHYEDVLVVRVHPELLEQQRVPERLRGHHIWRHRLQDIAAWERYLARQGIVILKFYLHLSKDEQRRRLLERLDDPAKRWKFSAADIAERAHWHAYERAYERAIAATAAPHAPWFVVPAVHKWYARLVVVEAMIAALEDMDLHHPDMSPAQEAEIAAARRALLASGR